MFIYKCLLIKKIISLFFFKCCYSNYVLPMVYFNFL